jgi:hypothetical protein
MDCYATNIVRGISLQTFLLILRGMRTEDDLHFYQLNVNRFCGLILLKLRVDRFF